MNKIKTTILLTILLIGAFTPFMVARASTGYILIDETTAPTPAPVDVNAGQNVSLYFGDVVFSGGQFYLVWSADGFSQISSGDFRYTPTFTTADLHSITPTEVEGTTSYPGGWRIGQDWVNGSIPKNIAGGHYYIKCFDGSATSVAVTDNYLNVLPSFEVVPDWGPGGRSIILKGYAFSPNNKVNLSYSPKSVTESEWVSIVKLYATNAKGQFNYSMTAPDMKQVLTPSGEVSIDWETVTFEAVDNKTDYTLWVEYTEYDRGLMQVADELANFEGGYLFGNETNFADLGVTLEVTDDLIISGQYFYPGNVTVWWDGTSQIGTALSNGSGFFNKTFTVPITSVGLHWVVLKDKNVKFAFQVEVIPTLILIPEEGPIGTVVTVKAYGFDEDTAFYLYWWEKAYSDDTWYWLANATTGSNGQFNTTIKFTVFHTYGGAHDVIALTEYLGEEYENGEIDIYASAEFTVTPRLTVVPSSFANDGKLVQVIGDGLALENPWYGTWQIYGVNIDNHQFNPVSSPWYGEAQIKANATGDLIFEFVAAGFAPGKHVVSIYGISRGEVSPSSGEPTEDKYTPSAYALFTVTGPTEDTQLILTQLNNNQKQLTDALTALSNSMKSLSDQLAACCTAMTKGVSDVRNDIAGVKSDVAALSTATTAGMDKLNSAIGTMSSSVGSKIDSLGNSLSTKIDSMGTNLGKSVSDNANAIQSSIQSAQKATSDDVKKSVGDLSTFLIIIGILAAITLVVELAILIRRLS